MSVARIAIAVGSSIATVAVFETNAERIAEIRPNAMTVFAVLFATHGIASMRNAKRRATPCSSIAWAMMNAPMKTKTVEEPNGARISSAGPTASSTSSPMPMSPPTGIGTASLIHRQMTSASTGGERVLVLLEVQRQEQDDDEQQRREEEADRPPAALEALLRGGEPLLGDALVGPAPEELGDEVVLAAAVAPLAALAGAASEALIPGGVPLCPIRCTPHVSRPRWTPTRRGRGCARRPPSPVPRRP
jgi:hypothetical protein